RTGRPSGVAITVRYGGDAPRRVAVRSTSTGPARSRSWRPSKATTTTSWCSDAMADIIRPCRHGSNVNCLILSASTPEGGEWRSDRPSGARHRPQRARGLLVQRCPGPGHLRGEGQGPAQPAVELLRPAGLDAGADSPDGGGGRVGRVDRGPERGRGVLPRVQP